MARMPFFNQDSSSSEDLQVYGTTRLNSVQFHGVESCAKVCFC